MCKEESELLQRCTTHLFMHTMSYLHRQGCWFQVMTAMREATQRDEAVPALPRLRTTDRELQHLVAV